MKLRGYADVVVGLQFGDEGKARVVDLLAKKYDIIARFNGGSNAGHTIENKKGKVALQQIPSGIFYPDKLLYIGSGCVVNVVKLVGEIEMIEKLGIIVRGRLKISCQASIIQPHHIIVDEIIGSGVGTTKNGIGPAYADKATRMNQKRLLNIRLSDMVADPAFYLSVVKKNLSEVAREYNIKLLDVNKLMLEMKTAFLKIRNYIEDDPLYLQRKVEAGATVLFEGAQSAMLDVSRGSVPYVTSSSTIASAAYVGGDLPLHYHRKTIGIAKAIMSRVGFGPFPSELGGKKSETYCQAVSNGGGPKYTRAIEKEYDVEKLLRSSDDFSIGMAIRILSGEYGTVTTRPRRIGMFDLVQLAYSTKLNGVNELIINKCDILNAYKRTKKGKIPVVTSYSLDGGKVNYVPSAARKCYKVRPRVKYWESFSRDITGVRTRSLLPKSFKTFITRVEKITGTRIKGVGVGPERNQFVFL